MNKKLKFMILFLAFISFSLISCSDALDPNEFTFDNQTGGTIYVNFRAEELIIPAGQKLSVKEFPKGRYSYETVFEVPPMRSVETDGPVSGEISFNNGTKALLIFVSNDDGSTYSLFASLTIKDDLDGSGLTDPLANP